MKISIVMPSYNQGKYISAAIDSLVKGQKSSDGSFQLIVQDNKSDDNTNDVLSKYIGLDFVEIYSEEDAGQADALCKGFSRADGDIFGWLNSDDLLLPDTLTKVRLFFEKNPDVDVVYGNALFIDESDFVIGRYPTAKFDEQLLFSTCYLSQPSVFYRKNIYEAVGGVRSKYEYCMDYDLWIRFIVAKARIVYVDELFSATRIHSNTKTVLGGDEFVDEILEMIEKNVGFIPSSWLLYKRYSVMKKGVKVKYLAFFCALLCFSLQRNCELRAIWPTLKHYLMVRVRNLWLSRSETGRTVHKLLF